MTAREIKALPAVADLDDLGPCMALCTVGERNFVQAKLETGESNAECARLAGYSATNADSLKSRGYILAHSERVQNALLEQSKRFLKTELPKSLRVILEIRDNKTVKAETRLKAAVEIINRGGMNIVQEGHITHDHRLSDEQIDREMIVLAKEAGWTPEMLQRALVDKSKVIDVEFTEVREPSQDPKNVYERKRRARRRDMSPDEIEADKARIQAERSEKAKKKYDEAQYAAAVADIDPDLADIF
jgi:hypothetical protein